VSSGTTVPAFCAGAGPDAAFAPPPPVGCGWAAAGFVVPWFGVALK